MNRRFGFISALALTGLIGGCQLKPYKDSPTTQNVTDIDPKLADADYWYAQPARVSVESNNFDKLWEAADDVSRDLLFKIDRRDRRSGVLTTEPTVSAQWFEPWRQELQTSEDLADSSVATYSRTIQYSFTKTDQGFAVTPKVLVQRQAIAEKRISGNLNRAYFRNQPNGPRGSRELDQGLAYSQNYWYAVGRDELLEARIAEMISAKIKAG